MVSSLDHRFAHEVRDLLITPPETQPYTNLKRQLIERLTASAYQLSMPVMLRNVFHFFHIVTLFGLYTHTLSHSLDRLCFF